MNRFSKIIKVLKGIAAHPLNRGSEFKAIMRFLKWQLFTKSLGKTKVEVNPNVEIGVASGGKNTGSGRNLY